MKTLLQDLKHAIQVALDAGSIAVIYVLAVILTLIFNRGHYEYRNTLKNKCE